MDMLRVVECRISKAWDCRFSIFCSNSLLKVWKAGSNPKGNSQNCSEVAGNSVLSFFSVHSATSSLRCHLCLEWQRALVWLLVYQTMELAFEVVTSQRIFLGRAVKRGSCSSDWLSCSCWPTALMLWPKQSVQPAEFTCMWYRVCYCLRVLEKQSLKQVPCLESFSQKMCLKFIRQVVTRAPKMDSNLCLGLLVWVVCLFWGCVSLCVVLVCVWLFSCQASS